MLFNSSVVSLFVVPALGASFLVLLGAVYAFCTATPTGRRAIVLTIIILALAMASVGCGGDDGTTNPVQPAATEEPAVGETLIDQGLNAIANANGDGVIDPTPCPGIVC